MKACNKNTSTKSIKIFCSAIDLLGQLNQNKLSSNENETFALSYLQCITKALDQYANAELFAPRKFINFRKEICVVFTNRLVEKPL